MFRPWVTTVGSLLLILIALVLSSIKIQHKESVMNTDGIITYKPELNWLGFKLEAMVINDKLFKQASIKSVKLGKMYVVKEAKEYITISLTSGAKDVFEVNASCITTRFSANKFNFELSWRLNQKQNLDISLIRLVTNTIKRECRLWSNNYYKISTSGKCINCGSEEFIITFVQQKVYAKWDIATNEWVIEKPVYDPNAANGNNHDKIHCAKCGTYHQAAPAGLPGLAVVMSETTPHKFSK